MSCQTFLYTRKSHEEDDRQILSLDAQQKECQLYAERHEFPLAEVIRESHSARRPGRPLFNELLKRIEVLLQRGEKVRILAHKPDRLLRNIADWARLNELMDAGLELLFVTGSYENNAQGRLAFGVNVVFAKYYVDNLSEEVRKGLKEKIERGEWPGWAPLGYRNVRERHAKQRIVIDPVTAPLVVEAFEDYASGEYSLATLIRKLAARGLTGKRRAKPLTKSILRDHVLSNPFYCGLLRYKGEIRQGAHEPLISMELFEQVQAILAGKTRPKRSRHAFRYSGLFTCSQCGCALVGELKKHRYIYYRCSHRRGNCGEAYIREEALASSLLQAVSDRLYLGPDLASSLRAAAGELATSQSRDEYSRTALEQSLKQIFRRLEVLLDLRLSEQLMNAHYLEKREELEREAVRVREQLAAFELPALDPREAVERFLATCNSFADLLCDAEDAEARQLLRVVGSNYRLGGGKVDFEPVEPFALATQARNRPVWRAGQDDVRTIMKLGITQLERS